MKNKFVFISFIFLSLNVSLAEEKQKTFRERIREKIMVRIGERIEKKPAPELSSNPDEKITSPGDYTFSLNHDGYERFYKVHVPKGYNSNKSTPLLFSFHGGAGNMKIQANDKYYHHLSKSDAEGFIAVFPNGHSKFKSGQIATWNAGNCCGDARNKKIDDIGFIKKIIAKLSSQLNIDTQKIFAMGMSNGGMLSYRLACEMSDVFKAIAAVAGTDNTITCPFKKPISILHIHAKNDDHVLFNGGLGPKAISIGSETEFNSVPVTISKWVQLNECNKNPKRVLETEGAYCDLYSPCKGGTEVKLCVTETGGHSWPGGDSPRGGQTSKIISANEIIWNFFKEK